MSFVSNIVGSLVGADASRKASNTQADAARDATATQLQMFNQTREDSLPALQGRNQAINALSTYLGLSNPGSQGFGQWSSPINPQDVQSDPGYQFGLQQGTRTLENSAAARGGLYSGATMKALTKYGQDYAGTKYNEAFNRVASQRQNQYNMLAGLGGLGQIGANTVANAGTYTAGQVGNNLMGAANARGAASIANGNQLTNALNGAGYGAQKWYDQSYPFGFGAGSAQGTQGWTFSGSNPAFSGGNQSNDDIWSMINGG